MKGVKASNEKRMADRNEFLTKLFTDDCQKRAEAGFIDPPLSAPKAQKEHKKEFGVTVNSQKMYDLRRSIFKQFNLDGKGRPLPGAERQLASAIVPPNLVPPSPMSRPLTPESVPLTTANRDDNDPLFRVAVVPIEDEEQGVFLKDTLSKLGDKGLVDRNLKVDAIHSHYCCISNYPQS